MVELKSVVRELPIACAVCPVLYLKDYCGLALYKEYSLRAMKARRIPSGCINGLGELNAEEVKVKLG